MNSIRKSALIKPLAAHEQAEMLAKKKSGSAVERFLVKPDYAYPNTRMNRDELRVEMNKPSASFHDLRLPSSNEIGLLKLEVLQCIGLPSLDAVGENDMFCLAVCGSYAFKTDIMPPTANPMWLSKMRRACIFPLFHAYAKLYVGAFDNDYGERDDFAGRIVLDIARMRPNCTYDVTLPLRQSAHVYMRRPRGAIRIRFHVSWYSERKAILSYLPKGAPQFQPHESVLVNCCDKKSFQNVALVVHGTHMPGRFSMKLVRALVREINFTRIHILRYLRKQEFRNLIGWKNPIISGFVFCSWMHSVYANTVRYVPGNLITLLLLYLWKNYANYAINGSLHQGFLPPTWEEMFMALLFGTDENHQFIQPLEMTTKDDTEASPMVVEPNNSVCCSAGCTLDEVAIAFQNGVQVSKNKTRFNRVYRETFRGKEAVDFLVESGYASSRKEAVSLGRRLAEEKKLFEHVYCNHRFKDANLLYYFLIHDDSKYTFTTHEPRGKAFLRMLGFFKEDSSYAEDQLEMPYSNGIDHPRFTVKESLVIRAKSSRNMMEKLMAEDEEDDFDDAVELDMEGSLNLSKSMNPRRLDKFDSYFDLGRDPSVVFDDDDPKVEGVEEEVETVKLLQKPPLQDIDYKMKSDRPISDVLAEARDKVHGALLHSFNDRTYVILDGEEALGPEDMTSQSTRQRWSSKSEESLASIPEIERSKTNLRVGFNRSNGSKTDSPKKSTKPVTIKMTKEENDRLLKIGVYSNSNRWVAKLGVIVQPIVEIAYEWIYLFRALFNIFTWQDPILSFWVSIIGPIVAVVLHLFPWRIVLGVVGILFWGPQNWIIRILRERKGVSPPDMDIIVKKKKTKADNGVDMMEQDLCFSNDTNGNEPYYSTLNTTNVKHIAVPYSQLSYNPRFYDWPPEPEYARVLKEDPQSKYIVEANAVDKESFRTQKSETSLSNQSKKQWKKIRNVVRLSPRWSKKKGT